MDLNITEKVKVVNVTTGWEILVVQYNIGTSWRHIHFGSVVGNKAHSSLCDSISGPPKRDLERIITRIQALFERQQVGTLLRHVDEKHITHHRCHVTTRQGLGITGSIR